MGQSCSRRAGQGAGLRDDSSARSKIQTDGSRIGHSDHPEQGECHTSVNHHVNEYKRLGSSNVRALPGIAERTIPRIQSGPGTALRSEPDAMENAKSFESGDKRQTDKRQTKKPYTKPSFRYERVFETSALSCGKVYPHQSACHAARKAS